MDAYNVQGDKHPVLMRALSKAASNVAFHEGESSKSGFKYGPGDKPGKYNTGKTCIRKLSEFIGILTANC